MTGRLEWSLAYLSGPIDNCPNHGVEWRQFIANELHRRRIGVLNPCDKPTDYANEDENIHVLKSDCKTAGDFDRLTKIMRPIRNVDLRMADLAHFFILNIDVDVHMCGTYGEATYAAIEKKPVLIRCVQGKNKIPDWMYSLHPHELFFNDWESLLAYVDHINTAPLNQINLLNRWIFFDFEKIYPTDMLTG